MKLPAGLTYYEFPPAMSQDGQPGFRAALVIDDVELLNRMVRTMLPEGLVLIHFFEDRFKP